MVKQMLPDSLGFLLIGLAGGVALLYRGPSAQRWARRWLVALAAGYWFFSIPLGADVLVAILSQGFRPLSSQAEARGATAVVVLDGGSFRFGSGNDEITVVNRASAPRALEALRVYRMLDRPWVIVTGGAYGAGQHIVPEGGAIQQTLIRAGVDFARPAKLKVTAVEDTSPPRKAVRPRPF